MAVILSRQYVGNGNNICYDSYGNAYYCRSGWNNWGRWALLGILIGAAFFFFFIVSCISARRRKRGVRPLYGTGWASAPFGHGQARYNPNYANQQQVRPQSNVPPTYQSGGYYPQTENQGYFGGQQTGTELREPENAYSRGGEPVYQPPVGPPPGKGDGVIR